MTFDEMPAQALGYADIALPNYCGPLGGCPRADRIYQLAQDRVVIEKERGRLPRVRSAYRAANLARWIEGAEHRFAVLYDLVSKAEELADNACTHAPEDRKSAPADDFEAVLPACTC